MKSFLVALLLWPAALLAQSPFDGTWVMKSDTIQFPSQPEAYSLQDGLYECSTCVPRIKVKADGDDHLLPGSPYFSTIAVQVLNDHRIQITEKLDDKVMYSETDTVSADGNTLVEQITDSASPNGKPIAATKTFRRVKEGPAGASPISGSWQAEKIEAASENGMTVSYHSTHDGLEASTPGGEGYSAKFDGNDYPVRGLPGHNTVSLRRISSDTFIETDKQDGAIHYELRMMVSGDGKTMKVEEIDHERGTQTSYTMQKKSKKADR